MRGQKTTPKDTPATPPPTPDLFDSRAVLKPTQFLFPDDLKKRLRALSFEQDRSMSDIVREAVEQYLSRGGE